MEQKIREYEKFIAKETERKLNSAEKARLAELHQEMVMNFQHERLIHLIITLFFALLTIAAMCATGWLVTIYGFVFEMIPVCLLTLILMVLLGCYIRHYYFLENHTQKLYKYTKKLKGYE